MALTLRRTKGSQLTWDEVDENWTAGRTFTGNIDFSGDGTYYVDVDWPILARVTGTGQPTMAALVGNIMAPTWAVNDFNMCDGRELPHGAKIGTVLDWHCHMVTNGVDIADKHVKFEIEWVWMNINGAMSALQTTTQVADFVIPANTTDRTHFLVDIGDDAPATTVGCHIYPRLKRIAATGAAPTKSPFVTMLQAHVECDSIGTNTEYSK